MRLDVLIEHGDRIEPIEIKSGQTVASDFFKGLYQWLDLANEQAGKAWLIYGGEQPQTRQRVHVLPWKQISELIKAVS